MNLRKDRYQSSYPDLIDIATRRATRQIFLVFLINKRIKALGHDDHRYPKKDLIPASVALDKRWGKANRDFKTQGSKSGVRFNLYDDVRNMATEKRREIGQKSGEKQHAVWLHVQVVAWSWLIAHFLTCLSIVMGAVKILWQCSQVLHMQSLWGVHFFHLST